MREAWRELDLQGGGLQTVNLLMTRHQRRRGRAYLAWLGFPLGLHRFYLQMPLAWLYPLLSLTALVAWWQAGPLGGGLIALGLTGFAGYDLFTLERRVTEFNKRLRMALYLRQDAAPPPGYRGRYVDDDSETILSGYLQQKEGEKAGHQEGAGQQGTTPAGQKVFSFAEQEALLKEMNRRKRKD